MSLAQKWACFGASPSCAWPGGTWRGARAAAAWEIEERAARLG